jgi:hypothetical protein
MSVSCIFCVLCLGGDWLIIRVEELYRVCVWVCVCGVCVWCVGRDSLVGIAIRYGLDDAGIESLWG